MSTCVAPVWREGRFHTCGSPAKYEERGRWYCGRHDPQLYRETVRLKLEHRTLVGARHHAEDGVRQLERELLTAFREGKTLNTYDRAHLAAADEVVRVTREAERAFEDAHPEVRKRPSGAKAFRVGDRLRRRDGRQGTVEALGEGGRALVRWDAAGPSFDGPPPSADGATEGAPSDPGPGPLDRAPVPGKPAEP